MSVLRLVLLVFTKVGFKGSAVCRFHLDVSQPSFFHITKERGEREGMDFESLGTVKGAKALSRDSVPDRDLSVHRLPLPLSLFPLPGSWVLVNEPFQAETIRVSAL